MTQVKIGSRVRALFGNPKNDVQQILPELKKIKAELERISKMENKVLAIIDLFKLISPLDDRGGFITLIEKLEQKNFGQLDTVLVSFKSIQKHIRNSGRDQYGMNRTATGETVTASKVYLGEVFGIWTNTAQFWLDGQAKYEKMDSGVSVAAHSDLEYISVWYCINNYKAGGFVKSHTVGTDYDNMHQPGFIDRITEIEKWVEQK